MNRKTKLIFGAMLCVINIFTLTGCSGCSESGEHDGEAEESQTMQELTLMCEKPISPVVPSEKGRVWFNNVGRYKEVFNDSNRYQYAFAEKYGIKPIETLDMSFNASRPLVKVEDCRYYAVAPLTHSYPYLIPEAEMLLRVVGRNFIDSLHRRGGEGYRIIVTSMLRTGQTVKKLRRVNVNASDSSCHKFATTFDISHSKFQGRDTLNLIDPVVLKGILAEVLLDLRKQNLCMVKYERKTACFHITVTPKHD